MYYFFHWTHSECCNLMRIFTDCWANSRTYFRVWQLYQISVWSNPFCLPIILYRVCFLWRSIYFDQWIFTIDVYLLSKRPVNIVAIGVNIGHLVVFVAEQVKLAFAFLILETAVIAKIIMINLIFNISLKILQFYLLRLLVKVSSHHACKNEKHLISIRNFF